MKKVLCLILAMVLVLGAFAGCAGNGEPDANTFEIALITDKGDIDDKSFNQGSWEGVVEYANKNNKTHKYYKPAEGTTKAYLEAIDLAVLGGAKIIVTPGFLFEAPIFEAQTKYPEVNFILLDGAPHKGDYNIVIEDNVASIFYSEEEAGLLAGYAAVMDGYTSFGYMGGMAVPAVKAFGMGYVQGIETAAAELGLADGSVDVQYHYTGDFADTTRNKSTSLAMILDGAEVVFGCGGSVGKSVFAACSETDAVAIGVDVDQKTHFEKVITSATKGLAASVIAVLDAHYTDTFATYGGKSTYFDAKNNGIGLPDDFSRFKTFTDADYDAIYAKLVDGSIDPLRDLVIAEGKDAVAADYIDQLKLKKVNITLIA